nr:TIGR04388 family protein [Leptospira ilyithenensis]
MGGTGRTVTAVYAANVYTDWGGPEHSDGLAWNSINGAQQNFNKDMNGNPWFWGADRVLSTYWFQMANIGYDVVYALHDGSAADQATYWNGNYGSLNGQLSKYMNQITPAIQSWESQVASYNSFHEQWKTNADDLKAQAKIDYDNARADLEVKKTAWIQKMEDERHDSTIKWNELSTKAAEAESTAELKSISKQLLNTYNASIASANISTNVSDAMSSYKGSMNDLSSREFTFYEPSPVSMPALNNSMIPKDALASISLSAIGNKMISQDMVFGLSNALGVAGFQKDAYVYSNLSSTISNISNAVGGFFGNNSSSGGQKFSILGAATEKTIDTSLKINGKDISEVFANTTNGVYQFSQLLSINENNTYTAKQEQSKLVNQMAYHVNWDNRAGAKLNEDGDLVLVNGSIGNINNDLIRGILKKQADYVYKGDKFDKVCVAGTAGYAGCQETEKKINAAQTAAFNNYMEGEINLLKAQGYEFQNGMIVKSLSMDEKILLGQTEGLTLTDAQKQIEGLCYKDPSQCTSLLKKEFNIAYDASGGVTLSKVISNGQIGGRNAQGKYISGTQNESQYISLAKVSPVMAPKGKDLFDEWGQNDWANVDKQASTVMNDFYTKGLSQDSKQLGQATALIRDVEAKNEKKFQEAKVAAEAADSFLKDMIMAYISGGVAGIKASIKGKIEDQINSSLAAGFIRATGGSEDQIAMASQLISYMRGKVQEKKIKSNMAKNSLANAAGAFVATGLMFATGGMSVALGGAAFATNFQGVSGGGLGMVTGIGASTYRAVAGNQAADSMMNRITGPKDQLTAIKANENAMIKSSATTALAAATGIPRDVVGQLLTDYQGSQAAKKTRNAVNSNPIANIGSQIAGVGGGILKTAAVALGVRERDIQKMLSNGNRIAFSGSVNTSAEAQSLAYMNQAMGMSAPGMSYTSNVPTLKNKAGLVEELGQRIVVDEIVKATGIDKDIADASFRKQYGKVKQKKADKKAQNKAIRSTVITTAVTVATLGAATAASAAAAAAQTATAAATAAGASAAGAAAAGSAAAVAATTAVASTGFLGAVGSALATVGSLVGASATAAANVGAAIVNGAVQAIDGSRNGTQGIIAGLANGAIGAFTAGGGMNLTGKAAEYLGKGALGLGVSYEKQKGWGGALGLGGAKANVSISFSQRGNTTISGSMESGIKGIQLTASSTTNGATTIGANYNPSDKGPRQGWNLGANYDVNGGGFSGSVGYTNAQTGLGLTSTIDRNGLSTSGQLNGVSLATMTRDGFQYDEISWTDININKAQDMTDEIRQKASDIATIRENMPDVDINNLPDTEIARIAGEINTQNENKQLLRDDRTQEEVDGMSPLAREEALDRINHVVDPNTLALAALTSIGTAALAFIGLGRTSNSIPIPTTGVARVVEVARRRTEEGVDTILDTISDFMGRVKDNIVDSISGLSTNLADGVNRMLSNANEIVQMPRDWWNDTPAVNPSVLSKADAALLAAAVYSDVPKDKKDQLLGKSENPFKILGPDDFSGTPLEKLKFVDHGITGLDSMLVKRTATIDGVERTVYVYSLAGTEGGPISKDGATNASAVVGGSTQYKLALKNAEAIQQYIKDNDPSAILMTTGHSLGGGMAASISLQTGIPAITFNPAGTNFLTNGISNAFNTGWNRIDAYITPTDPLNTLVQRPLFPFIGPNGRTHSEAIVTPEGIFKGHKIDNFVDHYFKNENAETVKTPEFKEIPHTTQEGSAGGFFQTAYNSVYEPLKKKIPNKVKDNLNSLIRNTAMGLGYSPVMEGNKPEVTSRPLNVSEISNSSITLQQRYVEAVELPNVNDFKKGSSLKLEFPEMTPPEKIHETLGKVGTQMIKDAYFNYDASIKSKDLLEKFAKENGLNAPSSTTEQKQLYQRLQTELNTTITNAKADPLMARIDYTRENYARITTETLVNRYGDKIDTENSTDRLTVLKNGEGVILNQVAYDSQRDNASKIEFSDYTLYPGNECSPTATSIAAEYMGATSQNGMYQFVDDFIKQAHKDGILSDGDELKKDKYLDKVLEKYDQKLIALDIDQIAISGTSPTQYKPDPNNWKTGSIKKALGEGKPVVVGGEFNVSPVIGGHRLVIVGYDSTGWIVHDPYGNANGTSYQGSGMYAHYDYGKWDIGKKTAFVIENIQKE